MVSSNLKPFVSINKVTFHKVCGGIIFAFIISLAVFKYLMMVRDESERLETHDVSPTYHHKDCFNRFIDKDRRHMQIKHECMKDRLFIVGDVHGCFRAFKSLLQKANITCATDLVVMTGDFSNKGPGSKEMLKYIRTHPYCVLTVMGNHEYKLLEYKSLGKKKANSGDFSDPQEQKQMAWGDDLKPFQLRFIQNLPYTISIPSLNVIVAHASLDASLPLVEQKKEVVMSIKRRSQIKISKLDDKEMNSTLDSNTTTPKNPSRESWAASWNRSELVVFGHASARGLQLFDNAIGLDTGCIYGEKLSGLLITKRHEGKAVEDNEIVSVKCPLPHKSKHLFSKT